MSARGFTLIELVVTLAIIALLATLAVPMAQLAVERHKESELRLALRQIRGAIDAYHQAWLDGRIEKKVDEAGYPPNLDVLANGVKDATSPKGAKLYFLRRLPRDPLASADLPADETWGLRSYESPPDAPAPGKDVFDVYAPEDGKGLNGVPYREW